MSLICGQKTIFRVELGNGHNNVVQKINFQSCNSASDLELLSKTNLASCAARQNAVISGTFVQFKQYYM